MRRLLLAFTALMFWCACPAPQATRDAGPSDAGASEADAGEFTVDLDSDQVPELITDCHGGRGLSGVAIVHGGDLHEQFVAVSRPGLEFRTMTVADLDGDGLLEFIVVHADGLTVFGRP